MINACYNAVSFLIYHKLFRNKVIGSKWRVKNGSAFLAKPLFASNVIDEFERIARKNNMDLYREKKKADLKNRHVLLAEDVMINVEIVKEVLKIREMAVDITMTRS